MLLGLAALAGQVGAETLSPAQLANQAVALSEQGRNREAVALYREALKSADAPVRGRILINLGKAYGALEQWPEAWGYLSLAMSEVPETAAEAVPVLKYVEGKLSGAYRQVTVVAEPADAQVVVRGGEAEHRLGAPVRWWFQPGSHRVKVERDGFQPREVVLEVSMDAAVAARVTVTLEPVLVQGAGGPSLTGGAAAKSPGVPTWKWLLAGGGGALAVAGTVAWLLAFQRAKDLNNGTFPDAASFDRRWDARVTPLTTTSYVLWGVGGAALLTGGVLVTLDLLASGGPSRSSAMVAPIPLPGGAGLVLRGRF